MLATSTEYINLRFDSIVISSQLGNFATGVYSTAYNFYLFAAILMYVVSLSLFPTFAHGGAKNKEKLTKLVTLLSFAILGYGVLLIGFIQFIAPTVIPILYGANYQESLQPLYILTIGLPFYGLNRLMVQVLNATDCQKWTFYATSTGAVFNMISQYCFDSTLWNHCSCNYHNHNGSNCLAFSFIWFSICSKQFR